MSAIRLPDEHLFCISFLGILTKIWSIRVAEWCVMRVGRDIQGMKLFSKKLFK